MCGVTGFWTTSRIEAAQRRSQAMAMAEMIRHRGPDAIGAWTDPDGGIALGHTRLAIVELSKAGEQPMHSADGRFVLVFNGEIYNHLALREALEGVGAAPAWRGHSDTETLLAAFAHWGIEEALRRTIGMFALAMWDRRARTLTLARDRLGEKPLYYGWQGGDREAVFLFGSELKSLARHPSFEGEIDREALTLFMRFAYIPCPRTIYSEIAKLPPGTFAVLREGQRDLAITPYWSAADAVAEGLSNSYPGTPEEAVDELEALLLDAVGKQMMADVPLGAFLSGGIDSSTVVALMQKVSARPVKTFSIGFHEHGYNEADYAEAVANHLGTEHTNFYVTAEEARAVIPSLPAMYDEPFGDASQIPTHLVCQRAREHVTVALSGDAGDELFCGYDRYGLTNRVWRLLRRVPRPARQALGGLLTTVSPAGWNRCAGAVGQVLPAIRRLPDPGRKIHKGAGVLASASVEELYRGIVSHWQAPEQLVVGGRDISSTVLSPNHKGVELGDVEAMMATDLVTYLPDDILAKVDRAAMATSLETRVPLLDHRVVEFAWRLPFSLKLRDGQTKWILREVLARHVPRALFERPKMGFGLPIGQWLRGPLRGWAEELLDGDRLAAEGFIEPAPVREMWKLHLSEQVDVQYHLWDVLMFQAWLEKARDGSGADRAYGVPA